jgi:hypothetical protein
MDRVTALFWNKPEALEQNDALFRQLYELLFRLVIQNFSARW